MEGKVISINDYRQKPGSKKIIKRNRLVKKYKYVSRHHVELLSPILSQQKTSSYYFNHNSTENNDEDNYI